MTDDAKQEHQINALKMAGAAIRGLLDIAPEENLDSAEAGHAFSALHDIATALQEKSK
jgi:hypothetical protein